MEEEASKTKDDVKNRGIRDEPQEHAWGGGGASGLFL
jgi:hypothetical protein